MEIHEEAAWAGPTVLKPAGFSPPERVRGRGSADRGPDARPAASAGAPAPRPAIAVGRPASARGARERASGAPVRAASREGTSASAPREAGPAERPGGSGEPAARRRPAGTPGAAGGEPGGSRASPGRPPGGGGRAGAAVAGVDGVDLTAASSASPLQRVLPFDSISVCRWRSSAVERLICNQRVGGSIPSASSTRRACRSSAETSRAPPAARRGEVAKRSNATDCKSVGPRPSKVRILLSPPPSLLQGREESALEDPGETGCERSGIHSRGASGGLGDATQRPQARRGRGGCSSAGRAPAFQAGSRGFESRRPLQSLGVERDGSEESEESWTGPT